MNKKSIFDKQSVLYSFVLFFIVHGEMIFNKISWHDDIGMIYTGFEDSLSHGRWLYFALHNLTKIFPGYESVPVIAGCEVAILIALSTGLIFNLYEIRNKFAKIVLVLIFISIPAVTGNLGYMVSAGANFLGIFICIIGAYLTCKGINGRYNASTFVCSSIVLGIALGEYQCYLSLYITMIILYFIHNVLKKEYSWLIYFKTAIYYIGTIICGLIIYLVILKSCLAITNVELIDYAGINTYGIVDMREYIHRLKISYCVFFFGKYQNVSYTMFPFEWIGWRILAIAALGILCAAIVFIKIRNKEIKSLIQFIMLLTVTPIAFEFVFILYNEGSVHSLHMYQYTLLFVMLVVLSDVLVAIKIKSKFYKIANYAILSLILLYGILYIRYDSNCYMMAEMRQEQATAYFNHLIARIQTIEGYNVDYPIVFINEYQKKNYANNSENVKWIPTNPYNMDMESIINTYSWKIYMENWCNYSPRTMNADAYKNSKMVMEMPSYPNDGSIALIDGVIVVKF